MSLVYSPQYNMGLFGFEKLHPFDTRRARRAWRLLESELGSVLKQWHVSVDRPVLDDELLSVHTADHLQRLQTSAGLAKAFEVDAIKMAPMAMLNYGFLTPMRWAVRGSVIAARQAIVQGFAMNLGGGFHHSGPDRAEGFCLYSDIALMIAQLRLDGTLSQASRVAYIDLDAHQGNGVCHHFLNDPRVFIFDAFNKSIYPTSDQVALDRIDCPVPLSIGCPGETYLQLLKQMLPPFLDSINRSGEVGLAIYNAGTDVCADDELGLLSLSSEDVLERDLFVVDELRRRKIPCAMLPGGGYSVDSHRLIATSASALLRRYRSEKNS